MTKVPLKNAVVKIYDMTGKLVASGYTDESGRFITELLGGKYNITVEKSGYMPHEQTIDLISDKVKEVVLEKIKPYSIITHPVAVIGDRLGLTQTIPVTVVRTYPKTIIGDRLEHQAISLYPSGFDPNDPRWMPEGGWDEVIDFTSPEDLDKFRINDDACFGVENGLLKVTMETATRVYKWDLICYETEGYNYCTAELFRQDQTIRALAIALKMIPRVNYLKSTVLYLETGDFNETLHFLFEVYSASSNNCCLVDYISKNTKSFACLGKWIVVAFDFSLNEVKAYIEGEENAVTLSLAPYTPSYPHYIFWMMDIRDPNTYELLADIFIDWIAIKYG